jgi:hypothetical protein
MAFYGFSRGRGIGESSISGGRCLKLGDSLTNDNELSVSSDWGGSNYTHVTGVIYTHGSNYTHGAIVSTYIDNLSPITRAHT